MKNFKIIALIAISLVALSAADLIAQRRPENTRSAKAAYGYPEGGFHKKKKSKKNKRPKKQKKQKTKGKKSDASQPAYRKKNPWAN